MLGLVDWNRNSNITLNRVRHGLSLRFPRSGVERACPAVLVPFGSNKGEDTEITPAKRAGEHRGYPVYQIPDCSGGFLKTSPRIHNDYVGGQNDRLGKRLKGLIRAIKSWNFEKTARVGSFYLELRCTREMETESQIVYKYDVMTVLCKLRGCVLAQMQDPMGVSGYIPACTSATAKASALAKVTKAARKAEKAVRAEEEGRIRTAFLLWRGLFGTKFPMYGA